MMQHLPFAYPRVSIRILTAREVPKKHQLIRLSLTAANLILKGNDQFYKYRQKLLVFIKISSPFKRPLVQPPLHPLRYQHHA